MKKIYLAAPYTHNDPKIVADRVKEINRVAAYIMKDGAIVFSPISHSHYIAVENDLPTDFEFWQAMNHSFIDWADMVYVLKIYGWENSQGVKDEIEYATKKKKLLFHIDIDI